MPGVKPSEAAAVVIGECGLPFLPVLSARGVGADPVGRTGAMLTDLAFDVVPSGYRLVGRPGKAAKQAASFLGEDLDAFEEAWERSGRGRDGQAGVCKVNVLGPLSLASQVELANGHRALTDSGATRDLAESLADGLGNLARTLRRRCGLGAVWVQLDEPLLGPVLQGGLPTLSGLGNLPPLRRKAAVDLITPFVEVGDSLAFRVSGAHCVELGELLLDLPLPGPGFVVCVDVEDLPRAAYDVVAWFLQNGGVVLGVAPGVRPEAPPSVAALARKATELVRILGFDPAKASSGIWMSVAEGLEGADEGWSAQAFRLAAKVGEAFAEQV
jgi:hypothetical protein